MILYLDTSSLVKLYVQENHSAFVKEWVKKAEIVATCRVAYPETMSAMNRRFRNGDMSQKEYELLIKEFSREWNHFVTIDFDELEYKIASHNLCGQWEKIKTVEFFQYLNV